MAPTPSWTSEAQVWVTLGGVSLTLLLAIIGGLTFALRVSWNLGRFHEQSENFHTRVEALESANKEGEDHRKAVALVQQSLETMKRDMDEIKKAVASLTEIMWRQPAPGVHRAKGED